MRGTGGDPWAKSMKGQSWMGRAEEKCKFIDVSAQETLKPKIF